MELSPVIRKRGKHPVAEPTAEANDVAQRNVGIRRRAKNPAVVHSEAQRRLVAEGKKVTDKNILNYTEIQFGQYYGQTFKWALENSVGWAVGILRSYRRENVDNPSPLGVNKRLFHDYCMAIPVIAQAVDFSVRVEAAGQLAKDTGDDGHRLLEFSQYRDMSWREAYESDKAEHVNFVRNYILPKSDCQSGTKMDMFRNYCLERERQRPSSQPACVAGSSEVMPRLSGQYLIITNSTHAVTCLYVILMMFTDNSCILL